MSLTLEGCWHEPRAVSRPGKPTVVVLAAVVLVIGAVVFARECDQGGKPLGFCNE